MSDLTHLDETGRARMVDVSSKESTARMARAEGQLRCDAATLARNFGFDVQSREFWEGSLDVIRADIDTFVEIVDRRFS